MTEVSTQPFRRLRYFHGQMLTARDFQREQEYHREKLKLRMRCLLGYGVVCGLHVEPASDSKEAHGSARVHLTSGLGVDCDGNELLVHGSCEIDLREAVADDERTGGHTTVWIGIEYAERPVEPTRTVFNSSCADTSDCEHGYIEESYVVRVTTRTPPADERCETCCSPCEHKVLWLARIDDVDWNHPVHDGQIHMEVRRPFSLHETTTITGVNWIHGHTYTVDEAKRLLGTRHESGGLVVRFSGDIRVDSLDPGVVDVQVIEGGAGRNAGTWFMGMELKEPAGGEFTRQFRIRQKTGETLQGGDLLRITVRTPFLLDRCCRPVDGTHVGGKVPFLRRGRDADDWPDPYETTETEATETEATGTETPAAGCVLPPSGIGPWTSGTGGGAGVFESWFFIAEDDR
ncbi:hypothetical protein [Paractinoplanes atraurantiacus]|uniref:Uncharacterized protein n=1 Tax=Paractinoplanes atraurantiacus TaxID=1036182 RepID=A0A285HQK9_9ACTN|nr:hypothetical protein [Actinoplanes atraurantiacus]SNY37863.1 hypothetical protein SAMN05421748_105152 [Actinoplanes atraurantiacus]